VKLCDGAQHVAFVIGILFGLASMAGAAAAETADKAAEPKCVTAEVNPVTGHVFCIEPLGAPVEPPAPALPCKADDARGQCSWRPSCTPEPEGM
jgi:hypothetical protein